MSDFDAFAEASETVVIPQSGVDRRITISGRKAGTQSELRAFDTAMEQTLGIDQEVTYQTGIPGTSHEVVVGNCDSTYQAGSPSLLPYSLELFEGLAL